ncbi:CCAAT/enhancer-binding protein zeta, partial [Stegodyphus mimosarum]
MKAIVVQEVERLIFRPNLAERAKYYALCFLNQVILSHEESDLANYLIMIYFSQFKLFVKKGEVDTKMMSALLTGIARAYPFANLKDNVIMDRLDAMYRLVHMVSFNISIQALMLIFQVLDSKDSVSDRFYNVLYRKLFDPALNNSSRQAALLNLLYRAMKKDVAVVRVRAFVKRLLQVALYQAPNLQCGILMLISEINKIHPDILETVPSFQSDSDSEEHYSDISDETEANTRPEGEQDKIIPDSKPNIGSWVHRKRRTKKENSKSVYDLNCRNPLHARAECAHLWELLFLKDSFHPSVSLFAHQIYNFNEIKYNGDPLIDFTVARFLDRFVYRNPKKLCDSQLNTHTKVFGSRKLKAKSSKLLPINSEEYLQQNEEKVPAEERFIYHYLHKRAASGKSAKQDSDIESVCSEDFQKLIDNMHTEDEGKNSLNFAKELGLNKGKKASKRKADIDSDSDGDLEDQSELEDIEFEDEEFQKSFADLEEDMEAAELCEEDFIDQGRPNSKRAKKKGKNSKSLTDGKLFASADEFSALLEDNAGSTVDTLSGEALRNQDKSGAKQLAWEMERDRYVR